MPSCSSSTCTTCSTSREWRAIVNVSASASETLWALSSIPDRQRTPARANPLTRASDIPLGVQVRAHGPGRVNLIGEHTDYNAGLALPFAIARGVTVTAETTGGNLVEVEARDLGERDSFAVAQPEHAEGWRAFARGLVAEL